jgi:hypothetical protein
MSSSRLQCAIRSLTAYYEYVVLGILGMQLRNAQPLAHRCRCVVKANSWQNLYIYGQWIDPSRTENFPLLVKRYMKEIAIT